MAVRKVKLDIEAPGRGTIEVDGQRLTGIRGLHLHSQAGHIARITLDLLVYDIDAGIEAELLVPDKTAQTLIALGWTPPGDLP